MDSIMKGKLYNNICRYTFFKMQFICDSWTWASYHTYFHYSQLIYFPLKRHHHLYITFELRYGLQVGHMTLGTKVCLCLFSKLDKEQY